MTQLRTGRNLGPQAEALKEQEKLRPSVAAPASSYVEKRPDYIVRPSTGPGKLAQLGQALSRYVPHLDQMAAKEEERFRTAEEAKAMRAFQLEGNKRSFAEYSQAHPERIPDNPHFRRGYQGAYLQSLAIAHSAAMQERYVRELAGETDPIKVKAALDVASSEWIQANIRGDDFKDDPDLYADFFYQPAANSLAGLMNQHGRDAAAEHLRRNADTYSKLVGDILDTGFGNASGLGNPATFGSFLQNRGGELSQLIQRMVDDGSPQTMAQEVIERAVFNYAVSLGGEGSGALGPQVLKLLDHTNTPGDGKPLSAKPETRAKITDQLKAWRNERRSSMEFSQRQEQRRETERRRETVKTIMGRLGEDLEAGRPFTADTALMKLPGVHQDHWDAIKEVQSVFIGLRNQRFEMDPAARREFMGYRTRAYRGDLSQEDLPGLAGRFGLDGLKELQNIIVNTESGNDPVSKTMKGVDLPRAYRLAQTQLLAGGDTGATTEMLHTATEEVFAYALQGLEEHVKETTAATGKALSAWEASNYLNNIVMEAAKNPIFRDFTKPRDVRAAGEVLERYPELRQTYEQARNPSYDTTGRVRELISNPPFSRETAAGRNKAGDLLAAYITKPAEIGRTVAQEYGVGLADVPGLMEGWSTSMLGVPLGTFAQHLASRRTTEAAKEQQQAVRRDRLAPVLPKPTQEEEDKYGQ